MKLHTLLIVGFALGAAGCVDKERPAPAQGDGAEVAAVDSPATNKTVMGSEAFIRHMHDHASHLAGINEALAAGDLEAAQAPAYWLLRHEEVTDFPDDWQPHIENMRDAARAVSDAQDVGAARVAAQRIKESCLGCHAATGVDIDLSGFRLD